MPPAAAMSVLSSGGLSYRAAGGWANLGYGTDQPVAADAGTLFDLASLTKVVVTTPLVLLLRQRRAWDLDDPISRWLPGAPRSAVTIRHCLTHTAGLVWHRPYFALLPDAPALKAAVLAELGVAVPGPVCYSDLSFMLLGWAVENCAGETLDVLARRDVLTPLGMTSTGVPAGRGYLEHRGYRGQRRPAAGGRGDLGSGARRERLRARRRQRPRRPLRHRR